MFYLCLAYPCPLFEPPANGVVTCDKWQDGRLCSVFCNEGYEFASGIQVPKTYECNPKGSQSTNTSTWVPFPSINKRKKFQFPVPDCSSKLIFYHHECIYGTFSKNLPNHFPGSFRSHLLMIFFFI